MKGYSKAARRRFKKLKSAGLPELAETPKRKKRGQARMADIKREKDLENVVLCTRARRMGVVDLDKMRAQINGDDAGMALSLSCPAEVAETLWSHYTALTSAEARYHRSLGKSIYAKTAKIESMREVFEVRADDRPDLRTEEERDRDAVNAWTHWQGIIMRLSAADQQAIYAVYRHGREAVDCGTVTPAGKRFVEAMKKLADFVD